jgi:hypothetical protein
VIKNAIVFLILMFASSSHALELDKLNSEFIIDGDKQILEGDIISARLQIWPVDDQEKIFDIRKGTYIDEVFYLAEVVSEKRSENNSDVVLIDMTLVLVGQPKNEKITFKLDGKDFPVTHNLKTAPTEVKGKNLIMFEQESEGFSLGALAKTSIFIIVLVFLIGIYKLFNMYRTKKRQEREKAKFKKYWDEKFVSAEERKDFEVVYGRKKEWLRLVKLQTPPLVEFFRVMESVQYKKEWTPNDNESVKESFDNIRGIFN